MVLDIYRGFTSLEKAESHRACVHLKRWSSRSTNSTFDFPRALIEILIGTYAVSYEHPPLPNFGLARNLPLQFQLKRAILHDRRSARTCGISSADLRQAGNRLSRLLDIGISFYFLMAGLLLCAHRTLAQPIF